MMDQIASLMQRGLISPDAAQNMMQQVNYWQNKGIQPPLMEQGGAGTRMGATTTREPLLGYSNPKPSANTNKSPREQFIDEYDALVRGKAAKENRADFRTIQGDKPKPKIEAAATRYKDTVGTGPTHSDALYDMAQKMGYPVHDNAAMNKLFDSRMMKKVEHGFTTSDGKFLSRGEAMDLTGSPDSKSILGKDIGE